MENKIDIDKILPLVQRPGRYINHELNTCRKEMRKEMASICLCFPDLYEIGASNLGLEILYHVVNNNENALAERCFAPAPDMEALLRSRNIPLFSLESQSPLAAFDVIGFSLQYELCATNVLNMLDLSGLPLLASERKKTFPLIIGGGPMMANPEPMADFFDAFVLGDGEEVIEEIMRAVQGAKAGAQSKEELLLGLARIPGVYVPSLYRVDYNDDGTVKSVTPRSTEVPAQVTKRTVRLEKTFFPSAKIVPYLQTVHSRLNIEVARGCPRKCRFCQATKYYWPWRIRPSDTVLDLAKKGLDATGYEEVAFSSLSCTDYRDLGKLLTEVNARHGARRIGVSLPSLRCDQFSVRVARSLGYNKRASLTFAPEAGTERLRAVIGKELSQSEIEATLSLARSLGWQTVKLYFMVGLPSETDDDIEGINLLVRAVRKLAPGLNFNVTLSPFVPKAQTAFQWVPMAREETLHGRLKKLHKALPATVKTHFIDGSLLEGILARGDRRMARVILKAWEKGCRFDQWKEHFRYPPWQAALAETGIDPAFYLYRQRAPEETFPWDHLLLGIGKEALAADYQRALAVTADEGKQEKRNNEAPVPELTPPPPALKPVQRLRLRFARAGAVRFLSHLEQIEFFRRTLRRIGLPMTYTSGFTPQPRVAFGPAISVGYESRSEYVEVELASPIDVRDVQASVQRALPEGFTLLSAKKVPIFFPSLDSLMNVADYEIRYPVPEERIKDFLALKEVFVEKRKGARTEKIEVRSLVRALTRDGERVFLQIRFGPKRNVKPEKILQILSGLGDEEVKLVSITRAALFIEKKDGTLSEP